MVRASAALRLSLLAAASSAVRRGIATLPPRRPDLKASCAAITKPQVNLSGSRRSTMSEASPANIWGFTVKDASGNDVSLSTYQDKKALLIVNVASQCGFTPQYKDLQDLQNEFGDKGFSVLAFPCNQFGGQEPGSAEEVCTFVKDRFKTTFPIFDKIDVNGRDAHPLFEYLKTAQRGFITNAIKWNFSKFLVVNGVPTKRYGPQENPSSFKADIEAALAS